MTRRSTSVSVDEDLWIAFRMKIISERAKIGEVLDKLIEMYAEGEIKLE